MTTSIKRSGYLLSAALVLLGLIYMGLLAAMFISGTSMPPVEPYNTSFNVLVLLTAPVLALLWGVVHATLATEKHLFSRAALAFVSIAAALTSINRYVALTVVRQSLTAGQTAGLE